MLHFPKSQPAPPCLAIEKQKKTGSYDCGNVLKRLQQDFHNKCYICESLPTSMAIEHFIPKRDNRELMFSWDNLFFACERCNRIKHRRQNLLNCTDPHDDVENRLRYSLDPIFPADGVEIEAIYHDEKTINSQILLDLVFNGNIENVRQRAEATNLRDLLMKDMKSLLNDLKILFDESTPQAWHEILKTRIKKQLSIDSEFVSFKRWYIRDNYPELISLIPETTRRVG